MTLYDEWRKDFLFVDQQGFVKLGDRRMEEAFRAGMLSAADMVEIYKYQSSVVDIHEIAEAIREACGD